jgi:hypothetical protein
MLRHLPLTCFAGLAFMPLALAGCAGGAQLPRAAYLVAPIAQSEDYPIGPIDEITLHVWRNPELSADKLRVRPDGRLTIPLVQDIPAVGQTATELQEYIDGAGGIGNIGSVRLAAFRGRGVRGSYQRQLGRMNAAVAAGYDRRTFIAAAWTVLAAANGLIDETYYLNAGRSRDLGRSANIAANGYVSWFETGFETGNVAATGASLPYNRNLTSHLVGHAAVGVDYFDSEFSDEDFPFTTALPGLRNNL